MQDKHLRKNIDTESRKFGSYTRHRSAEMLTKASNVMSVEAGAFTVVVPLSVIICEHYRTMADSADGPTRLRHIRSDQYKLPQNGMISLQRQSIELEKQERCFGRDLEDNPEKLKSGLAKLRGYAVVPATCSAISPGGFQICHSVRHVMRNLAIARHRA